MSCQRIAGSYLSIGGLLKGSLAVFSVLPALLTTFTHNLGLNLDPSAE